MQNDSNIQLAIQIGYLSHKTQTTMPVGFSSRLLVIQKKGKAIVKQDNLQTMDIF